MTRKSTEILHLALDPSEGAEAAMSCRVLRPLGLKVLAVGHPRILPVGLDLRRICRRGSLQVMMKAGRMMKLIFPRPTLL
jgi:orotidine-5'-phosphate decarboxylase